MKQVIIARGVFSTLTISLNDSVNDKLPFIESEKNPLKAIEDRLNAILKDFEYTYYNAVNKSGKADDPVSDLVVKSYEPSKSPANPPADPKRKANT